MVVVKAILFLLVPLKILSNQNQIIEASELYTKIKKKVSDQELSDTTVWPNSKSGIKVVNLFLFLLTRIEGLLVDLLI